MAKKAQGVVQVKFYFFFNLGARCGWVVNAAPRPLYPQQRDPVPIVQEAERAPRPVWTGAENLAPPPGVDPRTVQPVASRFTACPISVGCVIERKILAFAGNLIPSIQLRSREYVSLCIVLHKWKNDIKMNLKKLGCECLDIVGVCKDCRSGDIS
jgi:hypothetical protein